MLEQRERASGHIWGYHSLMLLAVAQVQGEVGLTAEQRDDHQNTAEDYQKTMYPVFLKLRSLQSMKPEQRAVRQQQIHAEIAVINRGVQ